MSNIENNDTSLESDGGVTEDYQVMSIHHIYLILYDVSADKLWFKPKPESEIEKAYWKLTFRKAVGNNCITL